MNSFQWLAVCAQRYNVVYLWLGQSSWTNFCYTVGRHLSTAMMLYVYYVLHVVLQLMPL